MVIIVINTVNSWAAPVGLQQVRLLVTSFTLSKDWLWFSVAVLYSL